MMKVVRAEAKHKKLVSLAVEIREDGKMGRAYGSVIKDYSSQELEKIFDNHISKENAKIRTDQWTDILRYNQNGI